MSASSDENGGDDGGGHWDGVSDEPPVREHGTRLEWCMSETGEERLVVYQPQHDERWIDAASVDILDLAEMR